MTHPPDSSAITSPGRYIRLPWMVGLIVLQLILFNETWLSLLQIWLSYDAFTHGLLIIPISIFLIWQRRHRLDSNAARASILGVASLAGLSLFWWLCYAFGLQIGMHTAVIGMIPATVFAYYGFAILRQLAFPLAFLVFAIPFGEFIIPELVDVTATLTVKMLQIFGIPVIREGQFFDVPSGSYSIAEACAGLNYTIATLAFGTLVARLNFSRPVAGGAFVVAAVLFSIFANGIRATTIVLIMHFSDVDITAAKDHEFMGWIAYLLLIALLLFLASWLGDKKNLSDSPLHEQQVSFRPVGGWRLPGWAMTILGAVVVSVGAGLAAIGSSAGVVGQKFGPLPQVDGWNSSPEIPEMFRPRYEGFTEALSGSYVRDGVTIYASIYHYSGFTQDAEMINAAHSVLPGDDWRVNLPEVYENHSVLPISVLQTIGRPRHSPQPVLVWYWYEVNGDATTRELDAKIMEAKNFLTFTENDSTAYVLTAPIVGSLQETQEEMSDLLVRIYDVFQTCAPDAHHQDCISAR